MLKSAIATVMVSDMDRAARFYREVLGLREKVRFGNEWAEYTTPDGFIIGLHPARPGTPLPPQGGISVGFGVDDIDAERARLEEQGVKFFGPTVDSPPVRLAFFADADGYPLYLSSSTR